ncbi:MAG TPA: hypothetical protein PK530_11240, partial [Anaerolineales bacterium]|nr:hypothetical protein [Anaerolineales bacterium]
MELSPMLTQMCHEGLSQADLNAIAKARGFRKQEVASRTTFESFFLSTIGVENVLAELTEAEVTCLHLLARQPDAVNVAFFERIYPSARRGQQYYYGTFSQEFKPVYDEVHKNLVRRGILVFAEAKTRADDTKMERWRYRFPPEFVPLLPPLLRQPRAFDTSGEDRTAQVLRDKVQEITRPPALGHHPGRFRWDLKDGTLFFDGQIFQAAQLPAWQTTAWEIAHSVTIPTGLLSLSPVETVQVLLNTLPPCQWATPEQLDPALKIFCYGLKNPSATQICETGWKFGSLARYTEHHKTYYRLPTTETSSPLSAFGRGAGSEGGTEGLSVHHDTVRVDLRTIPFETLETLNALARLEVVGHALVATPDRVKLGRAAPEWRETPLAAWLAAHVPAFQTAFAHVHAH